MGEIEYVLMVCDVDGKKDQISLEVTEDENSFVIYNALISKKGTVQGEVTTFPEGTDSNGVDQTEVDTILEEISSLSKQELVGVIETQYSTLSGNSNMWLDFDGGHELVTDSFDDVLYMMEYQIDDNDDE